MRPYCYDYSVQVFTVDQGPITMGAYGQDWKEATRIAGLWVNDYRSRRYGALILGIRTDANTSLPTIAQWDARHLPAADPNDSLFPMEA